MTHSSLTTSLPEMPNVTRRSGDAPETEENQLIMPLTESQGLYEEEEEEEEECLPADVLSGLVLIQNH